MNLRRRILSLLTVLVYLSLPSLAGGLYICAMAGTMRSACCCKPAPECPATVRAAVSCCSQTHWPDTDHTVQLKAAPPVILVAAMPSAWLLPQPAPAASRWAAALRLPADPDPPELFLTSRSFLS